MSKIDFESESKQNKGQSTLFSGISYLDDKKGLNINKNESLQNNKQDSVKISFLEISPDKTRKKPISMPVTPQKKQASGEYNEK